MWLRDQDAPICEMMLGVHTRGGEHFGKIKLFISVCFVVYNADIKDFFFRIWGAFTRDFVNSGKKNLGKLGPVFGENRPKLGIFFITDITECHRYYLIFYNGIFWKIKVRIVPPLVHVHTHPYMVRIRIYV